MSGPKCGQAELNRRREAELRRQREREERIRRAREMQNRDQQRQRAAQRAESSVKSTVQQMQRALEQARSGIITQYAASELREWERVCQGAQQEFNRVEAALRRAGQQFGAATAAWRSNQEYYNAGHFDQVDFTSARQRVEAALQEGRRIGEMASARREEERLRRELERQQAEARAAVVQAQAVRNQLNILPHAALAPSAADQIDRQIARANQQIQRQNFVAATQTARQARQQCQARVNEVQKAFAAWQTRFENARVSVEQAQQAMSALDREFIETWAQGALNGPQAQLRAIERALTRAQTPTLDATVYTRIERQSREVQTAIEAAQSKANENYANEMRRETIVDAIMDVLEDLDFNVGADLSDEGNRLSDVVITAGHPSGQEVAMRVDIDRQVNMNLEDGVKGADCVADVYNLIEGLQASGIELEMTDWGYADPDRIKQGGTYFRTGRGHQGTANR